MRRPVYFTTAYRYPNEYIILFITILLILGVIAITAVATFCLSVVFVLAMLLVSFFYSGQFHSRIIQEGQPVTAQTVPSLAPAIQQAASRLQVGPAEIFVVPNNTLNAYTFGLSSPKTIVLNSALFQVMDRDELQFIIGHEMGHVILGHTWLNSLIGGMAGVPTTTEVHLILNLAFRWWNRACEYSADRAGMLACNSPQKAMSALIKLNLGGAPYTRLNMERALANIQAEDRQPLSGLAELMYTHPIIYHRIEQLQRYAASPEYQRLQVEMNGNI